MLQASSVLLSRSLGGIDGCVDSDPHSPRQVLVGSQTARVAMNGTSQQLRWNLEVDDWDFVPGSILRFPSGATMWMSMVCEGCNRLEGIPNWHRLGKNRGVFGVVLTDGLIHVGDSPTVDGFRRALGEDRVDRIATVLDRLDPAASERVLLKDLLRWAGVQTAYARAFPTYIPRLSGARSLGRVVRSDGRRFVNSDRDAGMLVETGSGRNQIATWATFAESSVSHPIERIAEAV